MWPCGLQPTRLLSPWDSPGKNTGVGCHFLLQGNLPDPGIEPGFPALEADPLTSEPPGSPIWKVKMEKILITLKHRSHTHQGRCFQQWGTWRKEDLWVHSHSHIFLTPPLGKGRQHLYHLNCPHFIYLFIYIYIYTHHIYTYLHIYIFIYSPS